LNTNHSKVLILDDNPDDLAVLENILRTDHEVFAVLTAKEAFEIVQQENVDIILLDIKRTDIDGHEICRQLKNDPASKNIPVIFVTSMGEVVDETTGLQLGAIDYLVKPVSAPIVKARVHNHLELKKTRDFLEKLSLVDGLTGIWNRRHFDETLKKEWRSALRANSLISVIMLDIDCFKQFNDHYGHAAGDDCLQQVAQALQRTVQRGSDVAARYGGEEFVVIAPSISDDEAQALAEKIRRSVEPLEIPHQASKVNDHVTVSAGVATMRPEPDQRSSVCVKKADQALYQAKSNGRNRVVMAV